MNKNVRESKDQIATKSVTVIKDGVTKEAWIALQQYFNGAGNGPEAKVACIVISTIAREHQAKNNERQLDILERRMAIEAPK